MGKGKRDYMGRKAILFRFIKRCAFTRKLLRNRKNIDKQEFERVYKKCNLVQTWKHYSPNQLC